VAVVKKVVALLVAAVVLEVIEPLLVLQVQIHQQNQNYH
jgi:hypothetical protein